MINDGRHWWKNPFITVPSIVIIMAAVLSAILPNLIQGGDSYRLITVADPSYGGSVDGNGTFDEGSLGKVVATPASGWAFHKWSGACSGEGACQPTMESDKTVTAHFVTEKPLGIRANNDLYQVDQGDRLVVPGSGVLVNDSDPNRLKQTAMTLSKPNNGILTFKRNGSFVYQHDGSNTTKDSFTYNFRSGGQDSNEAIVRITVNSVAEPPRITSKPIIRITLNQSFSYRVTSSDPEPSAVLTFSLDTAPTGMTIDSMTGLINWSIEDIRAGDHQITIRVENQHGLIGIQESILTVAGGIVRVPDVVTLSLKDAKSSLIWAGLEVGSVEKDSNLTIKKDIVISQFPEDGTAVAPGSSVALVLSSGPANQAPDLDAGADITLTFPATANLVGVVEDDGLPAGTLEIAWTQINGPDEVIFGDFSAEATMAVFLMPGIYVLKVTAFDGELTSTDEVTVLVNPEVDPAD